MQRIPVLIVGGSLVGLSAALFLSWRGVSVIVVDKHSSSSAHPRATGFTEHTLEYFRAVGIADEIQQVDPGTRLRRVKADSLSGAWHEEISWTPGEQGSFGEKASPCSGAAIAQDKLEPILRKAAKAHGADLRLGVKMLSFRETEDGVLVELSPSDVGAPYTIQAAYMIAADGADSQVREALGIGRKGVGYLRTLRSVLFRSAEAEQFLERGIQQFEIEQPGFRAFLTSYGDERWVLMFDDDRERSEPELVAAVHTALGREMAIEILATGRWEMAGRIAECYSKGRVYLAGDAAHQLPPTRGGFGANTGIEDAYNLAWKLEWVLSGRSTPTLLDTYDAERQPIGWLRHQQTFARPDYATWAGGVLNGETLYSNEAMELGQLQRSSSVIGAEPELPPAASPAEWMGQSGTRAPHVPVRVREADHESSTIDLFTRGFVLISSDRRWTKAAQEIGRSFRVDLQGVLVGEDVVPLEPGLFATRFGIQAEGASLVRPDGVVAWRAEGMISDSRAILEDVLAKVASLRR